jgi:outer membrane protein TolC
VPQVKSLPDPQLTTTAFLQAIQTAAGPQEAAMSLSQKLPWFGKLSLRSQVAYQDAMAAYAQASATELKVIEQVKLAYYDLYFLQNAIAETRKLEQPLKDIIAVAKSRYETNVDPSGMVSVLQTQVELAKLQTDLVKLDAAKIKAQARLSGVLNLPPQTRIDAMRNLVGSSLTEKADSLVCLAEQCQPTLESRRREIARDRSGVKLACRNYYPDVTVGFNWNEIGNTGLSPVANGRDAYSLTAGVNLPIYRKRLNAAVREARYKKSSSNRRYAASRDLLQTEVLSLYAQFLEQEQVIKILEKQTLLPAKQALELSMEHYRTGKIQYEQLIDSFRALLNFRIDYYRRFAQREQAIASLERAVGCAVSSKLEATKRPDVKQAQAPASISR